MIFHSSVTDTYTGADASLEIIIMLLTAFILGYLFCKLLGCCGNSCAAPKSSGKKDDLKVVEGIGPKIEQLLNDDGIHSFDDLANAKKSRIVGILDKAGPRFQMHDPSTWPRQAELARDGKWEELEEYQDFLDGGKV